MLNFLRMISCCYFLNFEPLNENSGSATKGRGILRCPFGNIIMAFTKYHGQCTNNVAEVILCGQQWCASNDYYEVDDSVVIVNMINSSTKATWEVKHIINNINSLKT